MTDVYVIGSLRSRHVVEVAQALRSEGLDVFDDWFAAGPEADDFWQSYETARGRTYAEALEGKAAKNVFEFDRKNLDRAKCVVLVLPAGKSAHMEFGRAVGQGKPAFVYFSEGEPERWDVMYRFATKVCFTEKDLRGAVRWAIR